MGVVVEDIHNEEGSFESNEVVFAMKRRQNTGS